MVWKVFSLHMAQFTDPYHFPRGKRICKHNYIYNYAFIQLIVYYSVDHSYTSAGMKEKRYRK